MVLSGTGRCFVCGLAFIVVMAVPSVAPSQVSGERAVVAGRDIHARDITIGIPPEKLKDAMRAILQEESLSAREAAELRVQLDQLSSELGARRSAVETFLRILGEQDIPLEKLPEKLSEIANRHRDMLDRLAVLNPEDPATKALVEKARSEIDIGHYDRADQLLTQAEATELAAARMAEALAQQAQEAADRRRLKAAETVALRGELALTRLRYR